MPLQACKLLQLPLTMLTHTTTSPLQVPTKSHEHDPPRTSQHHHTAVTTSRKPQPALKPPPTIVTPQRSLSHSHSYHTPSLFRNDQPVQSSIADTISLTITTPHSVHHRNASPD